MTLRIGDELKRESKVSFTKIPKLDERTVGPVEFQVDPADAEVSEGNRVLGPASSFGPGSPLRLSGPMVHDLLLTAPGPRPPVQDDPDPRRVQRRQGRGESERDTEEGLKIED
jgi:hypothetical protein